ncbi:MAG: N-acetyltransferase [Acidilobaceae archaeon]|nr:N-acetyltransferase [Acidilobaceae archaeon]
MSAEVGMEELKVEYTSTVFFVKFSDGSKAFLRYGIEGDKMALIETYTPPQHRGKGVAKMMVEKALEVAQERGLKIEPICSYSVYYFLKNPDKRGMLAEPYIRMSEEEMKRYYEQRLAEERAKEKE